MSDAHNGDREAHEHARGGADTIYKVFVGGIPWTLDNRGLMDMFSKYGAESAEVMLDKITNRSRGFGFVIFPDRAGMDQAIQEKHDSDLDGRKISVKSAIPQDQIPPEQRGRDRTRGYGASRYDRGYDRGYGGGDRYRYDSRGYGGGYERGYGGYNGGYSSGYEREPYRDPYRDPYYGGGYDARGYGGGGYDTRGGYSSYGSGYSSSYDRAAPSGSGYGPERGARAYTTARNAPYDRPAAR